MRLDQLEKFIVFKISVLPRPHIRRKVCLLDLAIKETHTYAPILILPPLVSWTRFSPGVWLPSPSNSCDWEWNPIDGFLCYWICQVSYSRRVKGSLCLRIPCNQYRFYASSTSFSLGPLRSLQSLLFLSLSIKAWLASDWSNFHKVFTLNLGHISHWFTFLNTFWGTQV